MSRQEALHLSVNREKGQLGKQAARRNGSAPAGLAGGCTERPCPDSVPLCPWVATVLGACPRPEHIVTLDGPLGRSLGYRHGLAAHGARKNLVWDEDWW